MTDTGDETTGDETGGTTDGSTTGDDTDGSTDTGTTGMDMGGTGGPDEDPLPGEPCDPFLLETGPCANHADDHPEYLPDAKWTCAPFNSMPDPDTYKTEFLCQTYWGFHFGEQANPWDMAGPTDMCNEDKGVWQYGSCENGPCLRNTNLLDGDCVSPQYLAGDWQEQNPMQANFCCSTYCDADNPCAQGYTCDWTWDLDMDEQHDVGFCVVY
jgi:hypothetical protein